ncbi:mycofactocin precursor MftA [Leifsonia sp. NPDC058230]
MDPKLQTNPAESDSVETTLIESDSLVEEISIDGMCGVY